MRSIYTFIVLLLFVSPNLLSSSADSSSIDNEDTVEMTIDDNEADLLQIPKETIENYEKYYVALNLNGLGTTPLAGISFDFYLLQRIQLGLGTGFLSIGTNVDYFTKNISQSKHNYSFGYSNSYYLIGMLHQLRFGYHYSYSHFKYSLFAGPALIQHLQPSGSWFGHIRKYEFIPWVGVSVGYRF